MNTTHLSLCVLAAGLVAAAASTQAPPPAAAGSFNTAPTVARVDGGLRAVGANYKACFDRGSLEFTPALGTTAPHNLPLRFTLESIRRGPATLFQSEVGTPIEARHDTTAVMQDRDGVTERFEARDEGIEITYTFARRPAGTGDLVVRGRIDSELRTDLRGLSHDGIAFRLGEIGGVNIGAVTGVAADGRRAAGSLRYDGNCVEFILPGDFVDGAAYPLVLDPLVGSEFTIVNGDNLDPDIAYDTTNGSYLCVFEHRFSQTDIDVYGRLMTVDGTLTGSTIFIATSTAVECSPSVANVNIRGSFLCAWQDGPSLFGPFDINVRAVNASNGALSAEVAIAASTANEIEPDLGNEEGSDDEVLLVYNESGAGLRGAQINLPSSGGDPTLLGAITIVTTDGSDARPAISNGANASTRRCVTWQVNRATSLAVEAVAVNSAVTPLGNEVGIANLANVDEAEPDVDGDGQQWMIVYEDEEGSSSFKSDVYCQPVHWNSTAGSLVLSGARQVVAASSNVDERAPAVGFCGEKYLVAWAAEGGNGTFDYRILARGFLPGSCIACGPVEEVSPFNPLVDLDPEIGTRETAGSSGNDAMVVFSSARNLPPFTSSVHAHRWAAFGSGGSSADLGGGCGAGGSYATSGMLALGGTMYNRLSAASPLSSTVTNFSFSGGSLTCGSCRVLLPEISISATATNASGNAVLGLPVPCDVALVGVPFWAQWLTVSIGTTPCLRGVPVSASNIRRLTVGL